MKLTDEQKSKIFETLGTASMAWSETPKGIFDDGICTKIGNELIEFLESLQPSAPSVSAEEIEKKVWGMLAILPKESKCHDELLGDCFPVHSVLKAIKLSIEYAQAQQGKGWVRVEDGFPELSGEYFVYGRCTGENYDTADMAMFDMITGIFHKAYQPTHWMPLPSRPNQ